MRFMRRTLKALSLSPARLLQDNDIFDGWFAVNGSRGMKVAYPNVRQESSEGTALRAGERKI